MSRDAELSRDELMRLLEQLDAKLGQHSAQGVLNLYGGAAMCLVLGARASTKDIDAVYEPKSLMNELVREVAEEKSAPTDWLNDGVKGFISANDTVQVFAELPHLSVRAATPEYLFAMKCQAVRGGISDKDMRDIEFLAKKIGIKSMDQALEILAHYYGDERYSAKTWFVLQSLFSEDDREN